MDFRVLKFGGSILKDRRSFERVADIVDDTYTIGFEDLQAEDPIASSQGSENVLRIYPTGWERPVTIIGPGAGPTETVAGIILGLSLIWKRL